MWTGKSLAHKSKCCRRNLHKIKKNKNYGDKNLHSGPPGGSTAPTQEQKRHVWVLLMSVPSFG